MEKVLLDVFGADNTADLIRGAVSCVNGSDGFILVMPGPKDILFNELSKYKYETHRIEIVDAPQIITNDESPAFAVVRKPNSSVSTAMRILRDDKDAVGMVAAGNTGAVLAASAVILGRLPGVAMPALATMLPNQKGTFTCLLDCGANVDCKTLQLCQYARIGSVFMHAGYGFPSPKVALLSIGTEDKKGNAQTKEVFEELKKSDLNFVGNMEARDTLSGDYDVIVCDGFTGNILLKSIEGTARYVFSQTMSYFSQHADTANLPFIRRSVGELAYSMDFNVRGGAVLLGANKVIVKAHGSAVAETVQNVVAQLLTICHNGANQALRDCIL